MPVAVAERSLHPGTAAFTWALKAARVAYEGALKYAMASGNEGVVREAENFLAETQDQSAIDDSAFL